MKKKILAILFLFFTIHYSLFTSPVIAQMPTWSPRCQDSQGVAYIQGFECIFANIVNLLVPLAGLALFIMLIVGSFSLLTAGGEAKQIEKARKTITYAIFGLVAFLGIWFILKLIQTITGVDVTQFAIPGPNP